MSKQFSAVEPPIALKEKPLVATMADVLVFVIAEAANEVIAPI